MKVGRVSRCASALILTGMLLSPLTAQEPGEVADQFRRNIDILKGYTWKSRVQFTQDGILQSTNVYQVSFDENGGIVRELISSEGKAGKKTAKSKDAAEISLSSIWNMIDAYTHMKPDSFRKAFGDNPRTVTHQNDGLTLVHSIGVISQQDSMKIWVDSDNLSLRKMELDSSLQAEPARLLVKFDQLAGGPTYSARSTFQTHFKKKSIQLVTENYDLAPAGR